MIDPRLRAVLLKRDIPRLQLTAGMRFTLLERRGLSVSVESQNGIIYDVPMTAVEPCTREALRMLKHSPATGRKRVLTPAVQDKLVQAFRVGNYVTTACAYAGISTTTFHKWMTDPELDEFQAAIHEAEAGFEITALGAMYKAGLGDERHPGDPELLFKVLKLRHRSRWGEKQPVAEVAQMQQRKLEFEITKLAKEAGGNEGAPPPVDSDAFKAKLRETWGFDRSGLKSEDDE